LPEDNNNGNQIPAAAQSMIRSHSVTGDLHGVQPDPIAADILRKEPEQETFVRLKITPSGTFLSPHQNFCVFFVCGCIPIYILDILDIRVVSSVLYLAITYTMLVLLFIETCSCELLSGILVQTC